MQLRFFSIYEFRGGSSSRRQATLVDRERDGEEGARRQVDRDSFSRWRDRTYYGPRKWLESALNSWDKDHGMFANNHIDLV